METLPTLNKMMKEIFVCQLKSAIRDVAMLHVRPRTTRGQAGVACTKRLPQPRLVLRRNHVRLLTLEAQQGITLCAQPMARPDQPGSSSKTFKNPCPLANPTGALA